MNDNQLVQWGNIPHKDIHADKMLFYEKKWFGQTICDYYPIRYSLFCDFIFPILFSVSGNTDIHKVTYSQLSIDAHIFLLTQCISEGD